MRTREKIFLLLAGISFVLGTFIYIYFQSNELEANYFRWLFANNIKYGTSSPMRFITEELPPGTLLYGGLSLFALVVLVVVLKMLRDGELLALRKRLMDILAAKSQTESILQEEVWRGKHERQAKDNVTKNLEANIERIEKLICELNEKEKLLKARDMEIVSLKTRAVEQQDQDRTWDTAPRSLRAELRKQADSLEASNATIQELEARLSAKTRLWESQLREKDALLTGRNGELAALRSELEGVSERFDEMEAAKKRAEHLLHEEIVQKKTLLEASELVAKNEENRLRARMRALEAQLGDKEKLLRGRDSEIDAIKRQVTELAAAKEELAGRLQDELGSAKEDQHAREALIKESAQKYGATINNLQNEIAERNLLLQVRDNELRSLKAEVKAVHARSNEMSDAWERREGSLQEDLRKERQRRLEHEAANSELERRHAKEMESLHGRVSEKDEFLKNRDDEIKALKLQMVSLAEQLTGAEAEKTRVIGSLEEQVRKVKEIQQTSDSAIKALEDNFKVKIGLLEKQLLEKQQSVGSPDSSESAALRSEINSLNQRLVDEASARNRAQSLLQEALREKSDLARSAAAHKVFEENFARERRAFENQLREKAELLRQRELELSAFKNQISELNRANEQTVSSLQETVKRNTEILQTKDAALTTQENRFQETIRALESQLSGKEELLEGRTAELKTMESKVDALTAQLAEIDRTKDQDARLLHDELRQKTELLRVKESTAKKLEERVAGRIRTLENQLGEKRDLLEARDSEIDALMAKVSRLTQEHAELVSDREKSDRLAQEELREKAALLQVRESSIRELEEQMNGKIQSLERQFAEKQKLLEASGVELAELRSQIYVLSEKAGEAEGARFRAESLLREERKKASETQMAAESMPQGGAQRVLNGESSSLDRLESERDELLKARDKLIQDLMSELKEKKTALAKHEIQVWQSIERRDAWKHRLSKFGIRLKD